MIIRIVILPAPQMAGTGFQDLITETIGRHPLIKRKSVHCKVAKMLKWQCNASGYTCDSKILSDGWKIKDDYPW